MPRPPVLGYLQSAVADNTAHSQMDKLLFEDEMSNIQPEWGTYSEQQEVYDPAKAISEGDFMPVGAGVKLFRGVPKWYRGQMVKEGKYLSPEFSKSSLKVMGHNPNNPRGTWATTSKNKAKGFALSNVEGKEGQGVILEFDVPEEKFLEMSEPFRKFYTRNIKGKSTAPDDFYLGGIPKEYLKKVHKGYQEGGPAERAPLLGYMNPAIQDETAHSQMDRLMFENELEQQPQHSMRTYQQGYDPAREWGEGMMPIGGALRLLKGSDKYLDMLKSVSKTAVKEKKNWEAMTDLARGGSKGQIKETPKEFLKWYKKDADKAGKDYATTKWIQRLLQ